MGRIGLAISAMAAAALATPASAAVTLQTNGSGQLTGITGLVVSGSTYNVTFADGTCTALFGGCTSVANFTFQTDADAQAAGAALLAAIAGTSFDSAPGTTIGCIGGANCFMLIPYGFSNGLVTAAEPLNGGTVNTNGNEFTGPASTDTSLSTSQVWALFSLSTSAVPEPASWAMMLLGFAGIGVAVNRKRRLAAA